MFGTKQIDCKGPPCIKQMNRVQNIRTEICKQKYNQVMLVLQVLASFKLALSYIKEFDAASKKVR